MNPEIEAEKTKIALGLQQSATELLIGKLADAQVEIRQLKAQIANLTTQPTPPPHP